MHLQETVTNWTDCLPRLPDGTLVKAVDRGDLLRTAKQIKPGCVTLLRHWYDHGQHYDNAPYSVKLDRARTFFNSFLDGTFYQQYASFVDIIAGWNEVWAESQTAAEKADRVEQERAMIQVFKAEHAPRLPAHVRYGGSSSAVGNSQPKEMYQLAVQEDFYIQDHPYSHWVQGVRSAGDWPNLSGLWNRKEIEYGIKPRYVFDEGGPFESAVDGWRSNKCLGGSVSAYVGAVRAWINDVKQTAAYKEGRIIGPVALFTTGRQSASWSSYWTEQPELNALADMFRAEWKPGTVTPPTNPPRRYNRFCHLVPGDSTPAEWNRVTTEAYARRHTVMSSIDDAFITHPNLTSRTVVVWGALSRHGAFTSRANFEAWVTANYPPLPTIQYRTF